MRRRCYPIATAPRHFRCIVLGEHATITPRRLVMLTRALPLLFLLGALPTRSSHAPLPARRPHTPSIAATASDSLEQLLTTTERQSWVAWQHHDGAFFQNFLSDDHVEVGTNGIATKAQVVAFVASGACTVTSYSVDHFQLARFDANTALLTYRAEQETMCGKNKVPSPTWVSSLFVHRNDKWVNALYQHTREE
jgi:hypothetical protein